MFTKLTIEEGRNPYHGVNVILTHYYIRFNPYLVIVRCEIIRIPRAFIGYIDAIDLPWDPYIVTKKHSIYYSVIK